MTPQQREALKQALDQHSLKMAVKDAAPEDVAALPQDFAVPSYNENNKPLYDNQLFPAVNSADDLIARGYATPDGQVTENGQMALSLKKVGALNDDYTLNDTGKAMMASREDLLKEENLPLYMKSKELDLDDAGELSWGEVAGNFLGELKKGGKNLIDLAGYDVSAMTPEEKASFDLQAQSAVGGLVKAGTVLPMGFSQIVGNATIKAISDNEEEEKLALAQFNQKFEKKSDEINNAKTAEVVDAMGQMLGTELGMQEARQQDIQTVGAERAQELESGGESAGGVAAMFTPGGPSMLTAKVAFGVAGKGLGAAFKPISRSLLQADAKAAMVLDKTKQLATLERQAGALQLTTQAAERQAAIGESMAQKFSQAGFTDRANNALRLANQARTKGQEAAVRLGGFSDEIAAVSDDLAKVTSDATVADKVLQMTQKASQIPYLPITGIGKALEYTGRGMIGIDKGLSNLAAKVGADKAYNAMNKITTLSGLGGVGVASGLGPAAFIPAAIKATWSTAPFIKATGEYVGLMGKEAMKARGQIGFWKRMYEMPNKGPMHRAVSGLMDTATLGGRVTGAAGRVGKGLAASYPVDLAFEWVAEGGEMNPNVLKQAAVETLVFGGTGAALGGITMGSAERIRSLQNGDATNFYRSITDPSQRVMFNGMAPDLKRAIGTFSASNPGAKVEFVTQGEGVYDRNTKTVIVNPNARNPLKPLLTHEFMHHMLNNGIGDGVVAQLVGDGYQTGGILRSKDGGYEQQYEEFKSEYVNRLRQQHERNIKLRDAIGDPVSKSERSFQVPDEKYLAEEYFIETNVDDMLGLVESGKLGKMAGRMVLNDKVRALGDAILNKSAILRDLHFRIGGVMDKQGKMVKGNGFLGGQLYQSPEIRRMFNKMVNESVGRRGGIDAAKMKARNGIELPISGKNDPILGEMSSLWESDADGNPLIDKNGDYIPLSKQTDELRSQAGMLLVDDLRARQSRGEAIPDGELAYNPENNTWSGQYLNDRQIELLSLSGRFNSKQIKQLKLMNESARATSDPNADPATRGHRFSVIYQPALKKNRKGQWRYDQIKPQLRDVVPYGVEISKDGNILIRIMSTNQLFANASEKAATKRGRSLYDGNMDSILRDANAIIDLHGKNQATDAYFKEKYGAQWSSHKEFINSVFGNVGKGHKDINPLVASDRVDAVVKSYRLDRMNKATQLVGATQLPYQNNLIKINYLPEGEPILDANGEPKDLRYTPRYEERMPEQRQMPEVSPEDLNTVANKQEAQGLWADGKRMFALNEMDEKVTPITSKAMLDSYSADAIGWMEPEQAPAPSQRFMPEGVDEDKFYSQLDRVITEKVPTRATAAQIMATIDPTRGSGVKAEEIKWSGIEQALASLEKDGKVSKEDLLNYLRNEGRVRFEEVKSDVGMSMGSQDFSVHVLPGGENYREVVLAMPKTSGYTLRNGRGDIVGTYKNREEALVALRQIKDSDYLANITPTDEVSGYTSNHFPNIPNYVAHMRTNERVDADGRPGLFVEEFQSDRHQAGRKQGYDDKKENGLDVATREFNSIVKPYSPATPSEVQQLVLSNLPSDTEWARNALGDNFERIRDLAKQDMRGIQDAPFRTTWPIQLFKRALRDAVDSGKEWVGWTDGKTQNERYPNRPEENQNGMAKFYNEILPNDIGKYVKPFGGKVEKDGLTKIEDGPIKIEGSDETGWAAYDNSGALFAGDSKQEVESWVKQQDKTPIWKVSITPEMRKLAQGQMRFMPEKDSGAVDLMSQTSLNGDPFMIMSAKWGTPKQTSQKVSQSSKPENHIVGLSRINGLMSAEDLTPKQKASLDDFLVKTASFATDSPGFRDLGTPKTKEEALTVISKVVDRMARNLLAIYDAVPPPIRSYWQRWYPLAYNWNQEQAKNYSITRQVVAGINARLSPGKDWIHNVNMTERILKAFSDDVVMTKEIEDGAMPIIDSALEAKLNTRENKNKPKEWVAEQKEKAQAAKLELQKMIGLKLSQMTDAQAAQLIRYYTQVVGDNRVLNYFEQGTPVYADSISWQSFSNLEKAINMYRNPSMKNISENMGNDHKIRSFFNNQESPNDPVLRDVTSDTHAVAAAYLLPLSQSSQQVSRNFGGASNAVSGLNGMYYIVADAYRKAADARGVEPRAMQSITWEGARSMFPRGFKKAENVKKVEAIWNRFERKEITKSQALQEINQLLIDFFAKNPNSRPRFAVLPRQ